jgi:integrative and conjugative element protein (TIGR02256 family)
MIEVKIGEYRIFIVDNVLRILSEFKQCLRYQNESCGILLGQVAENSIYIMKASLPSSDDKSTRTSCERTKKNAQLIINYEFENSDKKTIYLGEWHTHPEKHPYPSYIDLSMIKDQFKMNKLNEPFLTLFIQGTNGFYIGIYDGEKLNGININE